MKTKIILFVVGAAAVTLSFTFAASSNSGKTAVSKTTAIDPSASAPAGGIALEEK
ncbi:MAG: hypothetical protein ABJA70_08385 [Chryseolinea sp.]